MKKVVKVAKLDKPISGMTKVGGYYRWGFRFPFRCWVEEEIFFSIECGVYKYQPKK